MTRRLHTLPDAFILQPNRGDAGPSLRIDRATGKFSRLDAPAPADLSMAASQSIYGLVGIIRLLRGPYLIAITESEKVATIAGSDIRRITDTVIIPFSTKNTLDLKDRAQERADETRYLTLLNSVLGCGFFYFSYEYDLTHTWQRIAAMTPETRKKPLWQRADMRFFWNYALCADLIANDLDAFILPLMNGYVEAHQTEIKDASFQCVLISRRGWHRAGRRYTVRGLDMNGHAANTAETEMAIIMDDDKGSKIGSFVQTRGSIPLLWRQQASIKYKPKIEIFEGPKCDAAYKKFIEGQVAAYGRQIFINLVDQKGSELKLERAFQKQTAVSSPKEVRYVGWDFHKECAKMKYQNIAKLVAMVADELPAMKYFIAQVPVEEKDGSGAGAPGPNLHVQALQKGVFRTNCMDCLDRTNVVQSVFARRVLLNILRDLGVPTPGTETEFSSAAFERVFKNMWANNADALSLQYSGTGAQKTDYTRTGRRTRMGALSDLEKSATRYYLNNFCDGNNHDALDLFLGKFVPKPNQPSPFRRTKGSSSFTQFALRMCAILVLLVVVIWGFFGPAVGLYTPALRTRLWLTLLLAPVVIYRVGSMNGVKYVNKPHLTDPLNVTADPAAPATPSHSSGGGDDDKDD